MAGGTTTIASKGVQRSTAFSVDRRRGANFGDASSFRRIAFGGRPLETLGAPLVERKGRTLLAAVRDHDDVDIVKIRNLSDGSQLFSFGPSSDEPFQQLPRTIAQADQGTPPRRPSSSGFTKRSTMPKRPPRTAVPSSKPAEEPAPKPSPPHRPPSSFTKRSPILHSSNRAPISDKSGVPVAVAPTVTPAHDGVGSPSARAPLSGVRERSEAPVPTQDRLRPKSSFDRRSPISRPGKSRVAGSKPHEETSSNDRPKALSRPPSAFSKRSPVAPKSARKPEGVSETLEAKSAPVSKAPPSRPPSAFRKPTLASGHPPRKTPEVASTAVEARETAERSRPKRLTSAFKKASPLSRGPQAARTPGPRLAEGVKGMFESAVAKVAEVAEPIVEKVESLYDAVDKGGSSVEDAGGSGAEHQSDLHEMKLAELRVLAKERKIKGLWNMKKGELVEALEVSFSEDV